MGNLKQHFQQVVGLKERFENNQYIQRDLEDQIEEEYKAKGLIYKKIEMANKVIPVINVEDVLELLNKGYVRLEKEDIDGFGSIQAKYNLRAADVKRLFNDPRLKNKKRRVPGFVLAEVPITTTTPAVGSVTVTVPTVLGATEYEVTMTTTGATPETDKLFS